MSDDEKQSFFEKAAQLAPNFRTEICRRQNRWKKSSNSS